MCGGLNGWQLVVTLFANIRLKIIVDSLGGCEGVDLPVSIVQ